MSKVVVLGGSGGIGSVATRALVALEAFDEVVVADLRADEAARVAASVGRDGGVRVSALAVDATSEASLAQALTGATVALNCVGPFYRFGPPILAAALRARVDYVDVCDDLAPTRQMLELDAVAKEAGVSALIGMGNSPGLANVFVRLCKDMLLEAVHEVDILHIHGGEPEEGPAVVKHRIHAMVNDIPLFLDGKFVTVRQLEPSGRAHVVESDFRHVGRYPVYPYPHPETITLPRFIPGLRRATNLGVIFPLSYFELTQQMVRVGACVETPLRVGDAEVVPLDFSVAHILRRRPELLREAGVTGPAGCLKVVVSGQKAGQRQSYVLQLSSTSVGAGEGTGIPAAVGAAMMGRGKITAQGVFPPEAAVDPIEMMSLALSVSKKLGAGSSDSVLVESIDEAGARKTLPLAF
ncbi:MAG: saccharopine dehydrogenase NADP-binding domain-containing protein [Polyangiaceae bacterium]|nr:saccharopine dehydrogenase NADP-binding domain-containing protein [Polyangiaceae bacterium]